MLCVQYNISDLWAHISNTGEEGLLFQRALLFFPVRFSLSLQVVGCFVKDRSHICWCSAGNGKPFLLGFA